MKKIYAIRDRIAQDLVALQMYILMCFRTDEQAARYFADAINEPTSLLNKHPGDFELIQLGHLTDEGQITNTQKQQIIITGDALVAVQQPELVEDA